jgi:hypothetical protein
MEKKMNVFLYLFLIILLAGTLAVAVTGFIKIGTHIADKKALLKQINEYPVLKNNMEINEALKGEPKIYLIENYAFNKGVTVQDKETDCLAGEYLYISIVEETFTVNDAYIKDYKNEYWEGKTFKTMKGRLLFDNGTELQMPDNLEFNFSINDESRLKKEDLQRGKRSGYFMARYYPEGLHDVSVKKMLKEFKKNVLHNKQQYMKRYKYLFMKKGDTATFLAKIGNGKADLNIFEDRNVIAVRGNKTNLAKYLNRMKASEQMIKKDIENTYIMDYVRLGFWILITYLTTLISILLAVFLIASIFGKK